MNQNLTQSKATQPSSNQQTRPAHAEIARRAYEIWVKNGRRQGQCERNWLQAEQELRKQSMAASQSKPSGDKPTAAHSYSSGSR